MSHCPVAPLRVARIESIFAARRNAALHDRGNATYCEPSLIAAQCVGISKALALHHAEHPELTVQGVVAVLHVFLQPDMEDSRLQ